MRLIAEAGASKIQWGIISSTGIYEFLTSGFNPNVADRNYLRQLLVSGFPKEFRPEEVSEVFYYGAGCGTNQNKAEVKRALSNFFVQCKHLVVSSDLEAVGRAVFNTDTGIVGILGTGSSIGYYAHNKIEKQGLSLGYLIGDEGSGAYIGKKFLNTLLTGGFEKELEQAVLSAISKPGNQIVQELYKSKVPNAYLAGFLPIVKSYIKNKSVQLIVEKAFQSYIDIYIRPMLNDYPNQKIGLVGGVAANLKENLHKVFEINNIETPIIIEKPFDELVKQQKY